MAKYNDRYDQEEYWSESEDSGTDEGELSDNELRRRHAAGTLRGVNSSRPEHGVILSTSTARSQADIDTAIESKLDEIQVSDGMPFVETFWVTSEMNKDIDIEDDFKREDSLYQQALQSVNAAEKLLRSAKVPLKRPSDYYAEMVKSDDHMRRVREKMLGEQSGIEAQEKAKKQRALKKAGKQVQKDVLAKRQKDKKNVMDIVARHRKGLQNQMGNVEDDFDVSTEKGNDLHRQSTKSRKRQARDQKFQRFGGKGKFSKSNTKDSHDDSSQFSARNNKRPFKSSGGSAKVGSATGAKKRMGKSRRAQQKR